MVVGIVSTSPEAPPRPTFHVAPPPPPRPKAWSEFAIALAIALFLNLMLLLPFIIRPPVEAPPFQEPEAISVDLVPEPRAQPQPETKPEPEPEPQPEPEPEPEQPAGQRAFTRSGGDSDAPPGDPVEEKPAAPEAMDPEPQPDERTVEPQEEKPAAADIPGWARTIEPGYDMRAGNPETSAEAQQATRGGGGGDAYLNAMGKRIVANVTYPPEAGGRSGIVVFDLVVHRSGAVRRAVLVSSTGVPALDRAAAEAIQRSQPFAPFPPGVTVETADLRLTLKIAPNMP